MVYYYDADGDVEEDEDGQDYLLPRSWTIYIYHQFAQIQSSSPREFGYFVDS